MKVKQFATVVSGATPSKKHPEYYGGDIVWFTPKDLSDSGRKYMKCGQLSLTKDGFDSCSASMIPAHSVLMSSRAPIGLLAINETECCTNQGFKSIVPNQEICLTEYLYYYLKQNIKAVESLGSGTTFKEVDKASLEDMNIELPSIAEQHAVSSVLSVLDDAIDNNNSICADLEAAAKLLYDYWFVQFDFPDENGKPYKSSGGKMVWSDELKREIPDGWTVAHASDLFDLERGYSYSSGDLSEQSAVPFISLACFGRKLDYRSEELKHLKDGVEYASWVKPNDMLIACTDLTRGADIIGCPIRVPDQFDRYVYSMDLAKVINLSQDVKQSYLYQSLRTDWFHKFAKGHTSGTNVIHLDLDVFKWFALAVPPIELQESYEKICRNLFALSDLRLCESVELETIRNFLLPLLMNGQVTIGDDDK